MTAETGVSLATEAATAAARQFATTSQKIQDAWNTHGTAITDALGSILNGSGEDVDQVRTWCPKELKDLKDGVPPVVTNCSNLNVSGQNAIDVHTQLDEEGARQIQA